MLFFASRENSFFKSFFFRKRSFSDAITVLNSLHLDQADILSDLICVQAVFEGYQLPLRSKVYHLGGR